MARTVRAATGRTMEVSAELLGQADDDALRATQGAEPVDVLVLRYLADEFGWRRRSGSSPYGAITNVLRSFTRRMLSGTFVR